MSRTDDPREPDTDHAEALKRHRDEYDFVDDGHPDWREPPDAQPTPSEAGMMGLVPERYYEAAAEAWGAVLGDEIDVLDDRLRAAVGAVLRLVDEDGAVAQSTPSDSQPGSSGTDEDAYEIAALAYTQRESPGEDPEPALVSMLAEDDERFRAAVDAALKHDRARLAEMLRLAASGRRRYARTPHSHAEHLEHEAVLLDLAADVVAGDLTPMQSWLPSWMWTDEIREAGRG